MMRHHFQSEYFWHHYTGLVGVNVMDKLLANSKQGKKVEITPTDKVKHKKVDCLFIFLAILVVSLFSLTLTFSSYHNKSLGSTLVDKIYSRVTDVQEDDTHIVDVNKVLSNMVPISYVLYVYPKINERTYTSIVKINFKCKKASSRVAFHSSVHNIHTVILKSKDGEIPVKKKYRNTRKEMTILICSEDLKPDVAYEFLITVDSVLTYNTSQSIYLIKYEENGKKQYEMLMTNFGYSGARGAWPCFDEPSMEATWKIIVQHDNKYQAISNMPVNEVKPLDANMVETYFDVSPKMSSYVVALMLTEYMYNEETLASGIKIRVYAPPGRITETTLVLKFASLAVNYFSDKFRMKIVVNPLIKLDLLPVNSSVQHKQSWGLIVVKDDTFFDSSLMNSVFAMEKLALAISKEVCHQWFGNLLMQKILPDTWIKESVCGYLQILPLQYYYPSWHLDHWLFLNIFEPAMLSDANKHSQSIAVTTKSTETLNAATYNKPTSLVTMLANFIGNDVLLKSLQNSSSIDVKSKWMNQPGFPLLTTRRVDNGLLVQQKRFKFEKNDKDVDRTIWQVPISVKICGKTSEYILKTRQEIIPVNSSCDTNVVYYLNYGASGFYRVNYNKMNWYRLLKLMNTNHELLPAIDRASLLANIHSLVRFGHINIASLLEFTLYLKNEHQFVPWKIALGILDELRNVFNDTKIQKCIKEYTLQQVIPVIDYLDTFKEHSHPQKKLISLLLVYAVRYQMQPFQRKMENEYLKWQVSNGRNKLNGSIKNVILSAGILTGENSEWNFAFQQYKNAESTEMKNMLLHIISSTTNRDHLKRLVDYGKDDISILTHVCGNVQGKDIAWNAVETNLNSLVKRYSTNVAPLASLLSACLTTEDDLVKTRTLKASLPADATKLVPVIDGIVEDIWVNMHYRNNGNEVMAWFRKKRVC